MQLVGEAPPQRALRLGGGGQVPAVLPLTPALLRGCRLLSAAGLGRPALGVGGGLGARSAVMLTKAVSL